MKGDDRIPVVFSKRITSISLCALKFAVNDVQNQIKSSIDQRGNSVPVTLYMFRSIAKRSGPQERIKGLL